MPQAFPSLGPEYEPFLYAVVCDEGNGTSLTMVSAIARTGADPWKEAARIAKLPKAAALEDLARMIPDGGGADRSAIADRLFALLPDTRANRNIPFVGSTSAVPLRNRLIPAVIVLLIALALVSIFRKTPAIDYGQQPASSAPAADKADR
ncbi:hypothetical protein [Rhodoblastus sp.]|uniref:hypothetical protein n=1 Tax=Rhodoblastus sp. TaxID=1962975 RepID=UPI003F9642D7